MEKKFKLKIFPERCDAEALEHFIAELDKNEKEVFNLMEKCILNKE